MQRSMCRGAGEACRRVRTGDDCRRPASSPSNARRSLPQAFREHVVPLEFRLQIMVGSDQDIDPATVQAISQLLEEVSPDLRLKVSV